MFDSLALTILVIMDLVKQSTWNIEFVEQTREVCDYVIERNPIAIKYIEYQWPDLVQKAIALDGNALFGVKEKTAFIEKLAVTQTGLAIRYVRVQTRELVDIALSVTPASIQFVEQTPARCWKVLKADHTVFPLIEDPTKEMVIYALRQDPDYLKIVKQTADLCWDVCYDDPFALRLVKPSIFEQDDDYVKLCVACVKRDPKVISVICQIQGKRWFFDNTLFSNICTLAACLDANALKCIPEHLQVDRFCVLALYGHRKHLDQVANYIHDPARRARCLKAVSNMSKSLSTDRIVDQAYKWSVDYGFAIE